MKFLTFIAVLALAFFVPAFAQGQLAGTQAPAKPPTGIIVGQLVDGGTGSPVSSASISLTPASPPQPSGRGGPAPPAPPMDVLTDGNGRFVFHSLPAGSYSLTASRPGYRLATYGQAQAPSTGVITAGRRLELTDGQRLTNVAMKIWKYGSISGRLVDEAGEPAVGARLQVVHASGPPTSRRYFIGGQVSTDDRGWYRFGELGPGEYLVMFQSNIISVPTSVVDAYEAANSQSPTGNPISRDLQASGASVLSQGRRIGDQLVEMRQGEGMPQLVVGESGRMSVYPLTFYPGVRPLGSATVITLESGQERVGADFAVRPVPAATVNGRAIGPEGPVANLGVKLVPPGLEMLFLLTSRGSEVASAVTRADGTFTFVAVPAGNYTATVLKTPTAIRQQQPSQPTSVINVGSGTSSMSSGSSGPVEPPAEPMLWGRTAVSVGESNVDGVAIQLAFGITVSGRVEFEAGGTTPAPTPDQLQRMRTSLTPVDGLTSFSAATPTVAPDGSFKTLGSAPGRYLFNIVAPSSAWTLKSVTSAGRNVAHLPIDLGESDLKDVVVTFTDKAGEISGTVVGDVAADTAVAAFPVDYQSWIQAGMNPRALPNAPIREGSFRLPGVLAGDYLVVAVSNATMQQAIQNPQMMASIVRQGTRVTLGEREKRTLTLTVVQVRLP